MIDEFSETCPSYSDDQQAISLIRGSDGELSDLQREVTPHMSSAELSFCRRFFLEKRRIPCIGELRLLDRAALLRRERAELIQVESLHSEDPFVAETYRDLLAKRHALYPQKRTAPTLREIGHVGASYMKMIGRESLVSLAPPKRDTPRKGAALLLLLPKEEEGEAYAKRLDALWSRQETQELDPTRIPITKEGLLGILASYGGGLIGEPSLLPSSEERSVFSLLGDAYAGYELWNLSRRNGALLSSLAEEQGLLALPLFRATDGEDLIIRGREPSDPVRVLSLALYRQLSTLPFLSHLTVPKETVPQSSPVSLERRTLQATKLPPMTLLCAKQSRQVIDNGFLQGVSLCLDTLLALVSRGVDRRAVGFSLSYELLSQRHEEELRGQNLALLLGVYRATVELAAPQDAPRIAFGSPRRRADCVAFASQPDAILPMGGGEPEDRVYYLPLWEGGFPDFKRIRDACDQLTQLWKEGVIHSARATVGSPISLLSSMGGELEVRVLENVTVFAEARGFLLVSPRPLSLPLLGVLERKSAPREDLDAPPSIL